MERVGKRNRCKKGREGTRNRSKEEDIRDKASWDTRTLLAKEGRKEEHMYERKEERNEEQK